ncbi:hypothetical protein G5S37_11210 [Roseimicrobium sp. ORNL1]|nr:hypothetical protein G5S37_11210 [Roseimicrobium sp. ORNL1]
MFPALTVKSKTSIICRQWSGSAWLGFTGWQRTIHAPPVELEKRLNRVIERGLQFCVLQDFSRQSVFVFFVIVGPLHDTPASEEYCLPCLWVVAEVTTYGAPVGKNKARIQIISIVTAHQEGGHRVMATGSHQLPRPVPGDAMAIFRRQGDEVEILSDAARLPQVRMLLHGHGSFLAGLTHQNSATWPSVFLMNCSHHGYSGLLIQGIKNAKNSPKVTQERKPCQKGHVGCWPKSVNAWSVMGTGDQIHVSMVAMVGWEDLVGPNSPMRSANLKPARRTDPMMLMTEATKNALRENRVDEVSSCMLTE